MHRRLTATVIVLGVLAGGAGIAAVRGGEPAVREEIVRVDGTREADGTPAPLDGTLYLPDDRSQHPAVLLAHGLGGTKDSVAGQARALARAGYVVLTFTARGFGRSGGLVHLNSPDYEVRDGRLMIDVLAGRPEVRHDRDGDPRVGVVGDSYGGALALMLAATDARVDAAVPGITWHDLRQGLFPQFATPAGTRPATPADVRPIGAVGVYKRQWTASLLGAVAAAAGARIPLPPAGADTTVDQQVLELHLLRGACGRVAPDLCLGYMDAATTGVAQEELLDLLSASSPAGVAGRINVPTMLVQGQSDSLFPLSEADANARAIAANGAPVSVVWRAGGHDGGPDETAWLHDLTVAFLDRHLAGRGGGVDGFTVAVPGAGAAAARDGEPVPEHRSAPRLPGLPGPDAVRTRVTRLDLRGDDQAVVAPPGGVPAALTAFPGLGGVLERVAATRGGDVAAAAVLPGQAAVFDTAPLERPLTVAGAPRVTLRIASTAGDATVFASLQDVAPDGTATLPARLVSPVRLTDVPAEGAQVTVALPAIVRDVPAGHRLRVVVATTDQAYALPADTRGYRIGLAGDGALTIPQAPLEPVRDGAAGRLSLLAAGVLLLLVLAAVLLVRRTRAGRAAPVPGSPDVPVELRGLGKEYADGFRAVSDLTLHVGRGQVLGLLGPNGAGKTTTLRMLVGLVLPTEGEILVFGHRVTPGAPVLSRVGALIEGPGFPPHLSGLECLRLYWRSTGRPEGGAALEQVLEIAGLGDDVHRPVRTYSHGMRQRLAIAQAMLGLPELLVLDEPANGLDPPQIHEMREVLAGYAATGRTVVVSSHLLAEVEQTCTHVAVMHAGRLLAQGPVADLVAAATVVEVDVDDTFRAARLARVVRGVEDVEPTPTGLVLRADAPARAELVRSLITAGIDVSRVAPRRGLEQTFLALIDDDGDGAGESGGVPVAPEGESA